MNKKLLIFVLNLIFFKISSENLDTTFGSDNNGIVTTSIGNFAIANSVKLQTDGKAVVGGNSENKFTLARYTDGILDATFGTSGIVSTSIDNTSQINSLAIQTDQKIIAAGYSNDGTSTKFTLVRYNTDGTTDSAGFGTSGIAKTLIGAGAQINSIKLQTDSKIVAAGSAVLNGSPNIAIARYNTNGTLDTTGFGAPNGFVTLLIGNGCLANDIVIDSSGNIIVAGESQGKFALAKFDTTGVPVGAFGTSGIVTTTIGTYASAKSIVIDASGNYIVGGISDNNFVIAKYNGTTGVLDGTFGTNGIVTTDIGTHDMINSLAIQTDNKIVAAGISDSLFAIARYGTTGTLDSSFGSSGILTTQIGNEAGINSIALQTDGNIVAAGISDNNIALVRYKKEPTIFIIISNPINESVVDGSILTISGTSSGNASNSVKVYIDNVLFSTVTPNVSGSWTTGITSVLSNGTHTIKAELLTGATVLASGAVSITIAKTSTQKWISGNILRVDKLYGSDTTGARNGSPFLTIGAAITASQSGDTILVYPGTYNETISLTAGRNLMGVTKESTIISQNITTVTDTTLITMNENCSLQNLTLSLTSNQHATFKGIVLQGTNATSTSTINNVSLTVDNSTAGAGTSNVYGIHSIGSGTPTFEYSAIKNCNIKVSSINSGAKRGILADTAQTLNTRDNNIFVTGSGAGTFYALETNNASAIINTRLGVHSAVTGSTLQSLGQINLFFLPQPSYFFAYDATLQITAAANTFNLINFGINSTRDISAATGWSHTTGPTFTANSAGTYKVEYDITYTLTGGAPQNGSVIASLNGSEIPGSQQTNICSTNNRAVSISNAFLVVVAANDNLTFSWASTDNRGQLIPNSANSSGATKPSARITITKIA